MKGSPWTAEVEDFFKRELKMSDRLYDVLTQTIYRRILNDKTQGLYETFSIKERGKVRKIEAPTFELKKIQKILMRRFFYRIGSTTAAHGFVKKRSPVTNAQAHVIEQGRPQSVLRIDIKSFFPSVKLPQVWAVVMRVIRARFKTMSKDAQLRLGEIITDLCVIKDPKDGHKRLPTGAPTSPVVSNILLQSFDKFLTQVCRRRRLTYTRYADDIIISGRDTARMYRVVARALKKDGFKINEKKTKVMRRHRRQRITGVCINAGRTTISRRERRILRAKLHQKRLIVEAAEKGTKPWRPELNLLVKEPKDTPSRELLGEASWVASVSETPTHQRLLVEAKELCQREALLTPIDDAT